ncbi:hypothetical protein K6H10_000935 [Candida tropicalis]
MFKSIFRKTVPLVAFGAGLTAFPKDWRKGQFGDKKLLVINDSVLQQIESSDIYKELSANTNLRMYNSSHKFPDQHHKNYVNTGLLFGPDLMEIDPFPDQHHKNYVNTGLLFGPDLMEIDPVVFIDENVGELTSFYHLGDKLISQDGQIHNGVVSTILDEGLCSAGFPLLPSKKGVTAKLSIDFKNQAPPQSTVVLHAKVKEHKGRKVVIEGYLETLPVNKSEKPLLIAESRCVLVEPKWFKYFRWLQV